MFNNSGLNIKDNSLMIAKMVGVFFTCQMESILKETLSMIMLKEKESLPQ